MSHSHGRGAGRSPSGMLYVRDSDSSGRRDRDYPPIEQFAREIGVRVNDRGTIWLVDPGGKDQGRRVPTGPEAHRPRPDDWAPVTCWCEESIVNVPLMEIRAGRTRSCFRPGCGPAALKAEAAWRRQIDRWNAETAGAPPRRAVSSIQITSTGGTFT